MVFLSLLQKLTCPGRQVIIASRKSDKKYNYWFIRYFVLYTNMRNKTSGVWHTPLDHMIVTMTGSVYIVLGCVVGTHRSITEWFCGQFCSYL